MALTLLKSQLTRFIKMGRKLKTHRYDYFFLKSKLGNSNLDTRQGVTDYRGMGWTKGYKCIAIFTKIETRTLIGNKGMKMFHVAKSILEGVWKLLDRVFNCKAVTQALLACSHVYV